MWASGLEQAAPGVTEWEIFNEPDSAYIPDSAPGGGPNCAARNGVWVASQDQCVLGSPKAAPSGGNGHGGSAQAAAYWYLDAKRVNPSDTLVAGGFNFNSSSCLPATCYYVHGYFRTLSSIDPNPPDAISLHPYLDVDYAALNGGDPLPPATSGLPSAQGAIAAIDAIYPTDPQIWLTEVGVWLTYWGKDAVTSVCGDGNPQDDGSWEALPQRQSDRAGAGGGGIPPAPERVTPDHAGSTTTTSTARTAGGTRAGEPQRSAARVERLRRAPHELVRAAQLRARPGSGHRRDERGAAGVDVQRPESGRRDVRAGRGPALRRRTGAGTAASAGRRRARQVRWGTNSCLRWRRACRRCSARSSRAPPASGSRAAGDSARAGLRPPAWRRGS